MYLSIRSQADYPEEENMNKCYDSLDEFFVCQLQKIKCRFADCIYDQYKQKRYGMAPCKDRCSNISQLSDLKELMEYNELLDLSQFDYNTYRNHLNETSILEAATNKCISPHAVETLSVCNISNLVEKINTL